MQEEISEGLQHIEAFLEKLPQPVAKELRQKIKEVRTLIVDQRAPRFALIGRRGSGKSSLINAIFGSPVAIVGHEKAQTGKAKWWPYNGELGTIEVLDTRGLQEGSKPNEHDSASDPIDSILEALKAEAPDALLFLIKAKEVDSAVDADIEALRQISAEVEKFHQYTPPFLVVVTHCDELEPKNIKLHLPAEEDPLELQEKLERVSAIEKQIANKLREFDDLKDHLVTVIGVSSYQSWKRDGTLRDDERWRIEDLISFLSEELPEEARLEFVRISRVRRLQESLANKIMHIIAGICGGIAAIPMIPIADRFPITGLQVALIATVAYLSGRQFSIKTAGEFLSAIGINVGIGFTLREISRALVKVIAPPYGSLVSAGIAYTGTVGMGKAAIAYYINDVSIAQAKEIFQKEKYSTQ